MMSQYHEIYGRAYSEVSFDFQVQKISPLTYFFHHSRAVSSCSLRVFINIFPLIVLGVNVCREG